MQLLRRNRKGANAIEFGLTLPVFTMMLFGMIEYGYYFSKMAQVNVAISRGCREGAMVDMNNPDPSISSLGSCGGQGTGCPVVAAVTTMTNQLNRSGLSCTSCTASVVGTVPDLSLECHMEVPHQGISGFWDKLGNFPNKIVRDTKVRLEWQRQVGGGTP